jgi:signal transduction histidine kinase
MPEQEMFAERRLGAQQRKQLGDALHDLCQPLTTLQCRLEMASLTDTLEVYRVAAETGMAECRRLAEAVESMREILHRSTRETEQMEAEQ